MAIIKDALQNAATGVPNPAATAASSPQGMDQVAAAAAGAPPGGQLPPPNPEITSPLVQSHMDELAAMEKLMPPEMKNAYDRVLVAGKTMLYAPETAEAVHGLIMDKSVPMKNKLGEGIANLLIMLDNQGNGTIPKDVLIPVGVSLLFEIADYLYEVGIEVTEVDLADGMEMMIYGVYQGYNIPAEQLDAVVDKMGEKLGFEMPDGGAQAAPAEPTEEQAFEQGFAAEQNRGV